MTGRDAEREQLAAALWESENPAAPPWHAVGELTRERFRTRADALLPVVDRIANERAAAALEAAAEDCSTAYARMLRARAAALRASNGEGTT